MTKKSSFVRKVCALAMVSLLTHCVWAAAKPVAVWEASDFAQAGTVTKSDLTLTLPTDATYSTADKSVQIKDTGLKIVVPSTITNPFGTGNSTTIQVLVKFSNFPVPTADNKGAVVAAFNDEYLGSCIIKGGISRGIWNGNTIYNTSNGWPNKGSESVVVTTSDTVQKYVMSYTRSSSTIEGLTVTYEGVGGYLDGQIAYGCGALKSSPTISSIVIGGKTGAGSNFVVPTGMKVYGIALFTSTNTPSDLDSYVWPSEQTSRYEVTLNDGDTLALTPEMLENDVIAVTCNGSVSISGITSAAAFAKLDLMNVTGDKKYIFSDLSDSDYSALSAPIGGETYRFEGETALTTLPFLKKNTEDAYDFGGNVEIAKAVTISGQLAPYGNKGCYTIVEGGSISANYITLANKGGVTQNFVQNGGTVTATSSNPATGTTAALLLGHWGSTANYTVNGGTLSVVNAPIRLGWDGTGNLTVSGGTVTTAGFRGGSQNSHGGAGNLTLTSGKIILGASGIDLGTNGSVALNGGTLEATQTASVTVSKANGLTISGATTIDVADTKTLTISSSIAGSGSIVKTGNGQLTLPTTTIGITLAEGTITSASDSLSITLSDALLAAGKVLKKTTADSITTYSADDLMATKGDAKYASLENALADAAEGDEITLVKASAESIEIPANVTVATTSTAQFTGTVTGEGRIVFDGYLPADNSATAQSFTATTWTGTVEMKNYKRTDNANIIYFGKYANTGSTVSLNNVTATMFGNSVNNHHDQTLGTLEIAEGGWTSTADQYGNSPTYYANLAGSGTIKVLQKGAGVVNFIGDHSSFTGSIVIDGTAQREVFLQTTGATKRTDNPVQKAITIGSGCTMTVAQTATWTAPGGIKVDGTLKFADAAPSGGHTKHWMNGALLGSGTVDASECTPANKSNQVRIIFKGGDDNFGGTIKVKNNVQVVFTSDSATDTGMVFSDQGYVCVEHGKATLASGANWGEGGTGVLAWYDDATIALAGGTITGNLFMNSDSNLEFPSLATKGATITGALTKNGSGKINVKLPTTATSEEMTLLSFGSSSLSASDFELTEGPTGFMLAIEDKQLKLKSAADITTEVTKAVADQMSEGWISLGDGGNYKVTGVGGLQIDTLKLKNGSTLTVDPVRTPVRVMTTLEVEEGASIAVNSNWAGHTDEYSQITCGKMRLLTYPNTFTVDPTKLTITGLKEGVSTELVEETVVDAPAVKQLVLYVGDFKTNAKTIRISQFGDSITEGIWRNGYIGTPNYRIPLMQRLEAHGYKPVSNGYRGDLLKNGSIWGSSDVNGIPADPAYRLHNGVSAQRIYTGTGRDTRAGFLEGVEAHLEQAGELDVVTLKIGTNDILDGDDVDAMFEGWKKLVNKIIATRPSTRIVVTSVLETRSYNDNGKSYSDKIKAAVEDGVTFPENTVFYVDCRSAAPQYATPENFINNGQDTDWVHPGWTGYNNMADAFLPGVMAAYDASTGRTETPCTTRGAEANVPADTYRKGYVKVASFDNITGKMTTWGENPYSTLNVDILNKEIVKVAYYVERKTKSANSNRFVWVDMDPWKTGMTAADTLIPTTAEQKANTIINNLHVFANTTAIKNIGHDVANTKGTLLFTPKYLTAGAGISETGYASAYGYDWNNTLDDSADWGAMIVSRVDPTAGTNRMHASKGDTLFSFNGFNATGKKNMLGIGSFAVHGPQIKGNNALKTLSLNWMFHKDENPQLDKMTADNLEYGAIEIWVKVVGQPEEPIVDDKGITPVIDGAETIEITVATGPGEETVTGNTIPLETGVYTVKGKVGDTVVGTQNIGVVAAKAAETGTAPAPVTTAVAVPFKGKTVATLLNTALLSEGDTLMAWVDGNYEVWTLQSDKTWAQQPITRAGGENSEGIDPTTTALKCGQAVWVTTAGKIVTFGDTAAQGAEVEIGKGHNLLGSIAYADAEPQTAATDDQVQLIGEENISRYNKTADGWVSKIQKRTQLPNGKWVTTEETSNEVPKVKPGRGYWLIRK